MRSPENDLVAPYLSFNLANVYHSLGETGAALSAWNRASESEDPDLLFGTSFNRGVLLYELGRFRDAYDQFRYALTIDPSSVAAKANLELSLQKIEAGESVSSSNLSEGGNSSGTLSREQQRTLEYVRRKEEQLWQANEEIVDESASRDW